MAYQKYEGKEDELQISCMDYMRLQYPEVLAIHVPNEGISGAKGARYGAKRKRKGVVAGVPDILVFKPKLDLTAHFNDGWDGVEFHAGLAVELKVKGGRISESQKKTMSKLKDSGGWHCAICWSFDEFKELIDDYLSDI
jgi:hypothetical protein